MQIFHDFLFYLEEACKIKVVSYFAPLFFAALINSPKKFHRKIKRLNSSVGRAKD
jgi:hypothetical protein